MKYACLLYSDESTNVAPGSPEFEVVMAGYMAFGQTAGERILGGEPLEATSTATTVSVRDGQTMTTDGPFAETKEQLGGFYVLECADLDEAISLAAQIPAAAVGRVEVRPIPNFG
jgi:hypothetical protein